MSIYRLLLNATPHRRGVVFGSFIAGFLLAAAMLSYVATLAVKSTVSHHSGHQLVSLNQSTSGWVNTLGLLEGLDDSDACSPGFLSELRQIAFLPDGIHELIYTQDNAVACSVTLGRPETTVDLGVPDIAIEELGIRYWMDRSLDFIGQPELTATLLGKGRYVIVISKPKLLPAPVDWIHQQATYQPDFASPAGFGQDRPAEPGLTGWPVDFGERICDANQLLCVDFNAPLGSILALERGWLAAGIAASLFVGLLTMHITKTGLDRLWAFPTRFRYLMN